ncbi:hypothetical protein LVY72_07175 [Arthrobacter sp. I2-34]|uniref:Uncharacterized protein n=1 Tax=Arthrobacter hankyongi TaxID=2904801 RepID=A0ABS9L5E8_9MICC|nr:hypothetical protein [Arthrobacter hankyongi]MCG2621697.1 hypothetical protein [Arthrobacter hankyongi]
MDFIGLGIGIIAVLAVIGLTVWIALRPGTLKPGATGAAGAFGAVEEVFAPARYEARLEIERQQQAPAPAPLPGDTGPDEAPGPEQRRA